MQRVLNDVSMAKFLKKKLGFLLARHHKQAIQANHFFHLENILHLWLVMFA